MGNVLLLELQIILNVTRLIQRSIAGDILSFTNVVGVLDLTGEGLEIFLSERIASIDCVPPHNSHPERC